MLTIGLTSSNDLDILNSTGMVQWKYETIVMHETSAIGLIVEEQVINVNLTWKEIRSPISQKPLIQNFKSSCNFLGGCIAPLQTNNLAILVYIFELQITMEKC